MKKLTYDNCLSGSNNYDYDFEMFGLTSQEANDILLDLTGVIHNGVLEAIENGSNKLDTSCLKNLFAIRNGLTAKQFGWAMYVLYRQIATVKEKIYKDNKELEEKEDKAKIIPEYTKDADGIISIRHNKHNRQ